MLNEKPDIYVELPYHHVKAGWTAIKRVIEEEIPSNEDRGFLFEVMTDIAIMMDDSKNTPNKFVKLDLPWNKAAGIWHCCNVAVCNDLYNGKMDKMHMVEMMAILAPHLDGENNEDNIEDLQERKSSKGSPRFELIDGGLSTSTGDTQDNN